MHKRIVVSLAIWLVGAAQAQTPDCQSLLADLNQTLTQTQGLTRSLRVASGPFKIASNVTQVSQDAAGLVFEVTQKSGRDFDPETAPSGLASEEGWLGYIDSSALSCEGHSLTKDDGRYVLELVEADEDTDVEDFELTFVPDGETYLLEKLELSIAPGTVPMRAKMTTTFSNWVMVSP